MKRIVSIFVLMMALLLPVVATAQKEPFKKSGIKKESTTTKKSAPKSSSSKKSATPKATAPKATPKQQQQQKQQQQKQGGNKGGGATSGKPPKGGGHEPKSAAPPKPTPTSPKPSSDGSYSSASSADLAIIDCLVANMVYVEGGTFTMGATSEQSGDADGDEKPAHRVTVSSFYIGKYEVTQAEWRAVMGSNPNHFKGDDLPVENMSYLSCQIFIAKLNYLTGKHFRLPTEAEWEYAARGGNKSKGYKYSGSNNIDDVAWYDGNSGDETHPVGTKAPNELGLYDMSGNVYEWCQDWYNRRYYSSSPSNNPTGPSSDYCCVVRGGSWGSNTLCCRVSCRFYEHPHYGSCGLGLRLVLSSDVYDSLSK